WEPFKTPTGAYVPISSQGYTLLAVNSVPPAG
ncbi:hypothetical protein QIO75_gp1, partial [ssRNA phage Zoerhiza.4_5]